MNRHHSIAAVAIALIWLVYIATFDLPIPQDQMPFWLLRAAAVMLAVIAILKALLNKSTWRFWIGASATFLILVYLGRFAALALSVNEFTLARGSRGPVEDMFRQYLTLLTHKYGESNVAVLRFAYLEIVMPVAQVAILAWLAMTRQRAPDQSPAR